ncbi:DUF4347 domain-containing protein [Paraburkholderia sp. BCC1886]|uniref:DUF4347 domain-containing protein n=1 Tax=Paraburkholderia sp. BCC1886 TaxID=2562670 RepID=UPI001184616A|nr:DUF4347 domain-containing protein [Paraburkholderia sp. BCC1886]
MKIIQQLLKRFDGMRDAGDTRADTRGRSTRIAVTPAPLLMALEPRVVYDASVSAITAHPHGHGAEADTHAGAAVATNATMHAAPKTIAEHDVPHHVRPVKPVNDTAAQSSAAPNTDAARPNTDTQKATQSGAAATTEAAPHTVVFIDPSVPNYQVLIAGLPAGTEYVVLNGTTDGFAQIAGYLQTHKGVDSIQLISHGANGEIQAGSTWLNSSDLSAYSAELTQIGAAMKPGGDFLIYGCDVAQNADGQLLVQQVAALTHLNVAASTDATGATALGGNWTLEYQVGTVHTAVIESAAAEQQFNALLGVTVENYDQAANSNFVANNASSFTLDGVTYTMDQAVNSGAFNDSNAPFGPTNITDSSTDGVLQINYDGSAMTTMSITMASGQKFTLSSFDLDSVNGDLYIEANGDPSTRVQIATATEGFFTGTVDLSSNANFRNVTSVTFVDLNDSGNLTTSLDNLAYTLSVPTGPTLTVSSPTTIFTSGDNTASTPVVVNSSIAFADTSTTTAQSATISIANFKTGDELLYTPVSGISGVYSNGVLTLTGSATIAQWQAVLESITFTNTQTTPDTTSRTINFSITDSAGATATATSSIAIVDVDQTPIVTTTGGATAYTAGAAARAIDTGVTLTDSDSTSQTGATVKISNAATGDTLSFANTSSALYGNIREASYSGGVLTLTGTGTDAQYQNALEAVTFSAGAGTTAGSRTITFQTSDGTKTSAAAIKTVNVTVLPVVTTDSGSSAFVAGDNTASTPVLVDPGLTVSDSQKGTLNSATVTIDNVVSAEDSLSFTNNPSAMGNISGSYNATTGILSLNSAGGTATLAQWQAALRSITYTDSAITPNNANRTISFVVNDGISSSTSVNRTVTVQDTDQSPVLTLSSGSVTYVAGAPATTVDNGVTVTDRDSSPLQSATIKITGGLQTGDTLTFVNDGFATGVYDSGAATLTLTATGSVSDAQWMTELDKVQFSSSINATAGARTLSYSVKDVGGATSNTATRTVNVVVAPLVTTDSGSAAFIAGDNTASTPVSVDSGLTVADGSSTTLVSATVQITGNLHAGEDLLIYTASGSTGDIVGSYDASSGILTLTSASHATLAQWQAALRSIQYDNLAVTPSGTSRTIAFTVNDGANSSPTATRNVTVQATDQTPVLALSGSNSAYTAGSAPATIDTGITISDLDNTTLASATVSIGTGFHTGDVLSLASDGVVTSSYNPGTGQLTLTAIGSVSVSQWMTELDNVRFSSGVDATAGARTISYVVNDGTTDSAPASRTVSVTGVPVVTVDPGSASFVAGDNTASTPVALDSTITLADSSSTTLASATVNISGNFHAGEDVLLFVSNPATMGDITGSYDASTGVLTLTSASHASLAQWQAALRSIQYDDTAVTPDNATRTISFTVTDGSNSSPVASRTVTVTDTDQRPLVGTSGGTTPFVESDNATSPPVVVDAGVTVSDLDNTTLTSAVVAISGNYLPGEDVLAFNNTDPGTFGNISASFDATTGRLTLTGNATLAQWQAALRTVTYTDTAITPDTALRTISFTVNDGRMDSLASTRAVSVTGTDQSPVLGAAGGGNSTYLPGSAAHTVDAGITLSDTDSTTMASLTVQFAAGFQSGDQLSLNFNAATMSSNFNITYDSTAGILTVTRTGSMTLANWQAIVDNVQFSAAAGVPLGARTLSVVTSDGVKSSNTLSYEIDVVSSAPQVSTTSTGDAAFVAGDNVPGTPVTVDGGISVSDPLGNTLLQATVSITTNLHSGEDVLLFTNDGLTMGDISGNYNALTGTLTLFSASGTATDGQWDAALRAVMYTDTATTPNTATRTVSLSITDGTQISTALTRDITVGAVDQSPVVATSGGDATYVEGDNVTTTVVVDGGITVADADNTTLASATVAITAGFHAGEDQLAFDSHNDTATFGNITGSYDATSGVMTLTSSGNSATLAQWQAALRAITYTDTAITPDTTQRTISFSVNDGTNDSAIGTKAIDLTATEQSPVVTSSSGEAGFVSGDNAASAPITIDSGLSVTDIDSATLVSGAVSVSGGFHPGEDVLAFNPSAASGDIVGTYDASTGVMTLTSSGYATVAQWQAALDSITYVDTAVAPAGATRTISFSVNDGTKNSVTATRVIDLTATTQTPTLVTGGGDTATFTASGAGATPVPVDSGLTIGDVDSGAHPSSAQVSIGAGFAPGKDVLAFTGNAATGDIGASYDASTGVLTLHSAGGNATLSQWQAALAAVTYADTAVETVGSSRTIGITLMIGDKSATATRSVNVAAAVTPPPVVGVSGQPHPANLTTLPPHSLFIGGNAVTGPATTSPIGFASDTITTFPLDLGDSISNPLIVLDAFADAPALGAIPVPHTSTFSTGDFGELGASNGSGTGAGTHWHGSLSQTSVEALQPVPTPDVSRISLDQPRQAVQVRSAPNGSFVISLPVTLGADGLPAGADTHVELRLADGRPLPGWLHFDPVRGTLSGKVPADQRALQIAIITRDAAGHQTRRDVTVEFGGRESHAGRAPAHGVTRTPPAGAIKAPDASTAPHAALRDAPEAPLAKPSLAEQFARAHAALHVARPTLAPAMSPVAALTGVPLAVPVERSPV